jgi:PAS domain S-box-containing protein
MPAARTRSATPLAAENKMLRRELDELKARLGPVERPAGPRAVGESWHQAFAELLPDAAYVQLLDSAQIVAINSAGVKQFGATSAGEIIGRNNFDFIGEEHHEYTRAHMHEASQGHDTTVYLKRRRLRVDGTEYPAEVTASPMRWSGAPAMLVVVRDLSDLARTERKLQDARNQLAEAVESVSDGLALFDAEERFVFANAHYLANDPARDEYLKPGVTFAEFIIQALRRNPHLPKNADIDEELRKRLSWFRSAGASNEFQDGLGRWFLVTHRNTPSGAKVVMQIDITTRKKIEQEVRDRAEQLRLVMHYAPFGIYVRKGDKIALVNRALVRMFRAASEGDLIGRDAVDLVHPDDRDDVIRRMNEGSTVSESGEPFEQRYRRLDGTYIWTEATPTPIEWEGERGALVFMRNATARKEMRRAFDMQRAVLTEAMQSISEGLWVFDSELRLVIANERMRELMELPPEVLAPGTRFQDVMRYCIARGDFGKGDPDELLAERMKVSQAREPCIFERSGPSGKAFEVRYAPMPGGGLVATRTDITERREFERAREGLTVKLLAQARDLRRSNEELEQFAYVASHDLQEPLRSISGYCQLLQRRYKGKLDQNADEFIQFAVDGAQRMQLLINDLLRYSRVGTRGKPFEPTDCNKVVADALANLRQAIADAGAEVSCGDLPTVNGDAVQLGQLFQNLIGNAIKFRGDSAPVVRVEAAEIDGEMQFSVADNGIGIDPRHQERIFQIFQRLHERGRFPGTGIGLAVCKKIVGRHGGRIWVESAPGKGATFRFTLARNESEMVTEEGTP